jgi:hypothetical protein
MLDAAMTGLMRKIKKAHLELNKKPFFSSNSIEDMRGTTPEPI